MGTAERENLLRGKTALITGGARRLGAAMARALAEAGANVVIHYRHSAVEAQGLAKELRGVGVGTWTVPGDLGLPRSGTEVFAAAVAVAGPIDILVNNASIFPDGTFAELDEEALALNHRIHAVAPLELGRAMHAQGRDGAIVNLLDTRVNDYDRMHVAYHLSKRTLAALGRMMAVEFAPRIRVNAIAPGLVLPPEGRDEAYLAELAHTNPLNRYGGEADVVRALLFLLNSPFITGQTINVDGGRHLRGSFYG